MGSLLPLTLILLTFTALQPSKPQTQQIKSPSNLNLLLTNYTFSSYPTNFIKTGKLHHINLPSNLSDITIDTIRLRCGSLQKHGVHIQEFHLTNGVTVQPCNKRIILVRQNLGPKWSSAYFSTYQFSGYQLISPVLGLFAYNDVARNNRTIPSELDIHATKEPIMIDFIRVSSVLNSNPSTVPLCAFFDPNGTMILSNQTKPNVCAITRHGHVSLVVEAADKEMKASKWQIVTVSTVGSALGASLLSLLVIAMFVKAKKKARMDELERRAYEEEALQVSMVGHVRAVRTVPAIEHHEYRS